MTLTLRHITENYYTCTKPILYQLGQMYGAGGEKHLPVAELSGSTLTVTVGAVEHPMADVHHIQWLFVETENGGQLRYLAPGQAPKAVFELGSEKPVAVYAYCNLHGLWMTKL